ncbi:transmembrane protein 33-like [Amphiura filiformis]|uniref:transmembrane protein 33-like n=1 Tax=Amphiura filiformis TaxID=82378 RepID=UPI003B21EF11
MPVIEEVDENELVDGDEQQDRGSRTTPPAGGGGGYNWGAMMEHIGNNKIDAGLWVARVFIIVCSFLYIIPIYGPQAAMGSYQRALICNGLVSALRLHQRLPQFQFNREYLGLLLLEDSCHNLLYSLIFANSYPITLALTPVFLFAILHSVSFTRKLINLLGPTALMPVRKLTDKLISSQVQILRFIALDEIFIMPCIIFMMFTGRVSLLVPFMYFRFLTFRYASRRNPYCKQIFHEMRIVTENYCQKETTPAFIKNFLTKCITMLSRFAPQIAQQPPQQPAQ